MKKKTNKNKKKENNEKKNRKRGSIVEVKQSARSLNKGKVRLRVELQPPKQSTDGTAGTRGDMRKRGEAGDGSFPTSYKYKFVQVEFSGQVQF